MRNTYQVIRHINLSPFNEVVSEHHHKLAAIFSYILHHSIFMPCRIVTVSHEQHKRIVGEYFIPNKGE